MKKLKRIFLLALLLFAVYLFFTKPLQSLKYHAVSDAAEKLGGVKSIRELFAGFQKHLYEERIV